MFNPGAYFKKTILTLESCAFLSTFNRIDWDELINHLSNEDGVAITTDPEKWNLETPGYNEIHNMWKGANFNTNSIKWTNFYPETHFDKDIIQQLADYLRVNTHRAWISKVESGYFAPWHWDVDDHETEYLKKGEIKRYSCFISPQTKGHIFMLGNDYLFELPRGAIVKWNNYKDWHAGINAGMSSKYMIHLLAY